MVHKLTFKVGASPPQSGTYSSIHQSDIALFGPQYAVWINGTQPALAAPFPFPGTGLPNNTFPFARLASVTSADQSTTFLYHQMNGTTFAEEQWDDSLLTWIPAAYITVSNS